MDATEERAASNLNRMASLAALSGATASSGMFISR